MIYGIAVFIRNKLFDVGLRKQHAFDIPVIVVGNLSVGGTGKTPHVEYLIELLGEHNYKVGVLSRGYKRTTSGFILASAQSTSQEIGDEPKQIKLKYPEITVAVCEKKSGWNRSFKNNPSIVECIIIRRCFSAPSCETRLVHSTDRL